MVHNTVVLVIKFIKDLAVYAYRRSCVVALLMLLVLAASASAKPIYYSFEGDESGMARLDVDPKTGQILSHVRLVSSPDIQKPKKIAVTEDGQHVGLLCKTAPGGNLIIADQSGDEVHIRSLRLPERPDEIRAYGHYFLICGNDGPVWAVDAKTAKVIGTWNARRDLSPTGRQVEDMLILPGGKTALMTFQKDSRSGKHLGSRVVVMDLLPEPKLRHDLLLPRNRPDLHYKPEVSLREQGPNPEMIFACPATNTIALSLDLYGAMATFDLDAAVERGELRSLTYQTTSLDGSWGHTFPDRGLRFEAGGRSGVLVSNCGPAGGAVLLDLNSRKIIDRYETGTGLSYPVFLAKAQVAAFGANGKIKSRGVDGLDKRYEPGKELYLWDVSKLGPEGGAVLTRMPMDRYVYRVAAVETQESAMLVVVTGEKNPIDLFIFDTKTRKVIDQQPAFGQVQRFMLRDAVDIE